MTALEIVGHWHVKLEEIRTMYPRINDTMYQITSRPLDLTGIRSTAEPPMPGGDALVITAGWARDAEHADDTPHPEQIIIESAEAVDRYQGHAEQRYTFDTAWHRNYEAVPWLHANGYLEGWGEPISSAHYRLASLLGDAPDKPSPPPADITKMGHLIPAGTHLTRDQAERFWPGTLEDKQWNRLRQRAKYHRDIGEEIPDRHYPVDWIRHEIAQHLTSA